MLSFSFLDWFYYLHELKKRQQNTPPQTKQTKRQPINKQKQINKKNSEQQHKERSPCCSHQHEQKMLFLTTSCIHKEGRGLWLLVSFPLYLKITSLKDLKGRQASMQTTIDKLCHERIEPPVQEISLDNPVQSSTVCVV